MSACPRGGQHVPRFPASVEGDWIVHYCKKCGAELDRRRKRTKVAARADGVGWGAE